MIRTYWTLKWDDGNYFVMEKGAYGRMPNRALSINRADWLQSMGECQKVIDEFPGCKFKLVKIEIEVTVYQEIINEDSLNYR